jgi:hypothetical protein
MYLLNTVPLPSLFLSIHCGRVLCLLSLRFAEEKENEGTLLPAASCCGFVTFLYSGDAKDIRCVLRLE